MSQLPRQQIEITTQNVTGPRADHLMMERRRCPRRLIEELATAVFRDGHERFGLTRVVLIDTSHTGFGVRATQSFEPGTRLTLTTGSIPMPHKSGTVVRCLPADEGGYSVGVCFDRPKAA